MITKKVKPFGKLYWQEKEYFLLRPEPLSPDTWENGLEHRWTVVPDKFGHRDYVIRTHDGDVLYPPVRQIICSNALIELHPDMKEIQIEVIPIGDEVWDTPTSELEPSPEELQAISDEIDTELATLENDAEKLDLPR